MRINHHITKAALTALIGLLQRGSVVGKRGEETDYEKEEKRIKGQINILSSEY